MTSHQHRHGMGHGLGEEQMLEHTVGAYPVRFGSAFWDLFRQNVIRHLPKEPVVVDLACGAGLLLRDVGRRLPEARLHGYDVSKVMLEHARGLDWGHRQPILQCLDLAKEAVPLETASVDLITLTVALHHFDNPSALLKEVRRLLHPLGVFVLCEWERTSFEDYLARWNKQPSEMSEEDWVGAFQHYGMICRFSTGDWRYLLSVVGLKTVATADLGNSLCALVAWPLASS